MNIQFSIDELITLTKSFCPSIGVRLTMFYGEVVIDGNVVFSTQGPSSQAVINAYLCGMIKTKTLEKS